MDNVFSKLFKYIGIALIFSFLGFIIGQFIPYPIILVAKLIPISLISLLVILVLLRRKGIVPQRFSMKYVYVFSFIEGIFLYPTIDYYMYDIGVSMTLNVLFGTIVAFLILSNYAKNKNLRSILKFQPVMMTILIIVSILSFINMFFRVNMLWIILSSISIVVSCGYILYDITLMKININNIKDEDDLSIYVLDLYLDIINIFVNTLRLLSKLNDR